MKTKCEEVKMGCMNLSDLIKKGWVLQRKRTYTIADVDDVYLDSRYGSYYGRTVLQYHEAARIVELSAKYWEVCASPEVSELSRAERENHYVN
jgi:hypothetical protein